MSVTNRTPSNNQEVPFVISQITNWHHDRNLIEGSDNLSQFHKLVQECAELSDNLCKGLNTIDDYGDIMTVLIGMMERDNLTVGQCLIHAYNDIKDRTGRMQNGVFVKEGV